MPETIPAELEIFVERELASGKYRSREEVLAAGLRLLQDRERKLDALRTDLQIGLDQLERGEGIVLRDEESQRAFFKEIKSRGRERRLKGQAASAGPASPGVFGREQPVCR